MNYYDDPSIPTNELPPFVQPPATPNSTFEWATLQEALTPGGSASAVIMDLSKPTDGGTDDSADDGGGTLTQSAVTVDVYDYILPPTTQLASGSLIEIAYHSRFKRWCLKDWTCARS